MSATTQQPSPWTQAIIGILRWGLAVLLLISTLQQAWAGRSFFTLLIGAAMVALTLPPSWAWLQARLGFMPRGKVLVGVVLALLVAQAVVSGSAIERRKAIEASEAQQAAMERGRQRRAETLAYFEKNKAAVLADITAKAEAGQLQEALATATKYTSVSRDPDLNRSRRIVAAMSAKAELKNEASMPLEKRLEIYKALADFEPDNQGYAHQVADLQGQVDKRRAAEQAERDRQQRVAARETAIKAQFSPWDGSHRNLERLLQADMKNPKSYEHVSTRYVDKGEKILVFTTIRGTNSFNAVVPSSYVAEVDINGNVLSVSRAN